MSSRLFNSCERDNEQHMQHGEPNFAYLDRVAGQYWNCLRELLEEWFEKYPNEDKNRLLGRFRSNNDNHHFGAFFELFLFHLLSKIGYAVSIEERTSTESHNRLDFTVCKDGVVLFYLEATIRHLSDKDALAEKHKNEVLSRIDNSLQSPDFKLSIHLRRLDDPVEGEVEDILTCTRHQLMLQDYEMLKMLYRQDNMNSIPQWSCSYKEWKFKFRPFPRSETMRGRSSSIIGAVAQAAWGKDQNLKDKLIRKSRRYGNLNKPFLVAVNCTNQWADHGQILDTLIGDEEVRITFREDGSYESTTGRLANGVFKQVGMSVNGIISFIRLFPWNMDQSEPQLLHNPQAFCFPTDLWPFAQWIPNPEEGVLDFVRGKPMNDVLQLKLPSTASRWKSNGGLQ